MAWQPTERSIFFNIRELKNRDLMKKFHMWTRMSFVIDSHEKIKDWKHRSERTAHDSSRQIRSWDHVQRIDNELLALVETALERDRNYHYVFAFNLVNKWKLANKSSRDVFLLFKLDVPVKVLLVMYMFPIWFNSVMLTSNDEVKATLELHLILEKKYAKDLRETTATNYFFFDGVIVDAMTKPVRARRTLCVRIIKLWSGKLLYGGFSPTRIQLHIIGKMLVCQIRFD